MFLLFPLRSQPRAVTVGAGGQRSQMSLSENAFPDEKQAELIARIKSGEKGQFIYLADLYRSVIRTAAASFSPRESERDDLIQEGYIALYNAVCAYDNARGASFSTFAAVCIRNRMRNWIEKSSGTEAAALPLSEVDDSRLAGGGAVQNDFEDAVILKAELNELLAAADKMLSPREKRVFSLYIKGYSNEEICRALAIDRKSCENALFRIRRKLKTARM